MKRSRSLLYKSIALASLSIPATAFAQDDSGDLQQLEEIVVTGSFIKRDKFDMASPVESIDAVDIKTSGYSNIGSYIRDLTYTANVDTVANVLATSDGTQDSTSARFNLRGLGDSSTLTLFDGRRVLNSGAIGAIVPDIALKNVELIMDGGAATYGTDAIAGVVNMIPITSYEGIKATLYRSQDGENDYYTNKAGFLWGTSSDNFDVVAAIEYSEQPDPLYRSDRPEFLRYDNDSSAFGNPGMFTGFLPPTFYRLDPECGAANAGNTDDGQVGAFPSGTPAGALCTFEYGAYQDYKRPNDAIVAFVSASYDLNDSTTLQMRLNHSDRTSLLISSPSTGERVANGLLAVPATHPNNPFGTLVRPAYWRPFSNNGATQPSHLDDHGSKTDEWNYITTSIAFGAEYEIGNTSWTGNTWVTVANQETVISGETLNLDRLTLALAGQGGPNGNQWFNPFFSASRLSSSYVDCETGTAGCTANSQQLVDWLWDEGSYTSADQDYRSIESVITGDLFELSAGSVQAAFGLQYRVDELFLQNNNAVRTPSQIHTTAADDGGPAHVDYNSSIAGGVGGSSNSENAVKSVFGEFLVPILDNLEMTLAIRHESFDDLDESATVPKISLLYQPVDNLSLRASYGNGFLAPTIGEVTVRSTPGCAELFTGEDPVLEGSLNGSLSCSDGNPNVKPEESTIFNAGFTWRATDDLDLSLDYQTIDYSDRIIRLSTGDTLRVDFANMLADASETLADWDAKTDPDKLAQVLAWQASGNANPLIERDATTGVVNKVIRLPENVAEVQVDVVDFRLNYGHDFGDAGYLSANWSTTAYLTYEYGDPFGEGIDAAGKQNADTDIAPPLPEMKHTARLAYLNNGHYVGLSLKHQTAVDFDATTGPGYVPNASGVGTYDPLRPAPTVLPFNYPNSLAPTTIDAQTTIDLRYGYTFEELLGGSFEIAVGANNVTDERGQPLPVPGGLETRLHDPAGRIFYLEGSYTFE